MLDLPAPMDERLERSPLKLVVCQVRYAETLRAADVRAGLAVQEALGGREGWHLEALKHQSFSFSAVAGEVPAAPKIETAPNGWRMKSHDDAWTVTVLPDSVGIETTTYPSWDLFVERLGILLGAVSKALEPEAEERLGLRYINHIEHPSVTSPSEWDGWIRGNVLGLLGDRAIGGRAVAAQQQIDLKPTDEIKATIRHGFFLEQQSRRPTYVMDFDVYREGARVFDPNDVIQGTAVLNGLARQLFQAMITPKLYEYFRGGAA